MPLDGLLLVVSSSFWYSLTTALVKALGPDVPVYWVAFLRNAVPLPAVILLMRRRGVGFASARTPSLILRGLWGLLAMLSLFWALPRMPLANAALLGHAAPLYAALWGVLFLGERLERASAACILLAFAGVYLALKPKLIFEPLPYLAAFSSGIFSSLAFTAIKRLSDSEPPLRIVFYSLIVGTALFLPAVLTSGFRPAPSQWALMAAIGAAVTVGQVLLTAGIGRAPVSRASSGSFFTIVFNVALGRLLWGEPLDARTGIGCALIGLGIYGLSGGRRPEFLLLSGGNEKTSPLAPPLASGQEADA